MSKIQKYYALIDNDNNNFFAVVGERDTHAQTMGVFQKALKDEFGRNMKMPNIDLSGVEFGKGINFTAESEETDDEDSYSYCITVEETWVY